MQSRPTQSENLDDLSVATNASRTTAAIVSDDSNLSALGHLSYFAFPFPLASKAYAGVLANDISRRLRPRNDLQVNRRRNVIQRVAVTGSAADIQVVDIGRQWQRIYFDVN